MGINSCQLFIQGLLNGLQPPGDTGLEGPIQAMITPKDPDDSGVARIYVWPSSGPEKRLAWPRNTGPNTPAGWKQITHGIELFLTWFDDQDEDQDIDIWTGTNGTFVGSNTVQDSDIQQNVIWLTNPVPTGTYTVGQGIYVSGASATSNSGMFGLRYQQVGTNTGNWLGIQRSAWPGKYTANTIAVNGALTPQIVRAIMAQRELAMGDAAEESSVFAHANVTEQVAWEQNALLVQHIDMAQLKGDNSVDMLKKKSPTTIGGIEFLVNVRALPGYIDILDASNAGMVETKKVSFYEVGGQTLFGVIGQSGGQATSLVFYMQVEANLYWRKPRLNAFLSGIAIPHGLLGY